MDRLDEHFGRSEDLIANNIEQLKQIFPEVFTEDKIDFDVLKQLLGELIDNNDEKYGLNWFGKKKARLFALTPSLGTLRPCPDESVDWDNTKNIMIEGDNLEVLKILQKSYSNKIKTIYIDPPYNTGKDFVYTDDYKDSIKNYLELTGQSKEGSKISSNNESSGRFHTNWLNMIYPRLCLAKNLLKDDGVMFISIDNGEVATLIDICKEIFGEENIEQIVWKKYDPKFDKNTNAKIVSTTKRIHEYIIAVYKNRDQTKFGKIMKLPKWLNKYTNPDNDPRGCYKQGIISYMEGHANEDQKSEYYYSIQTPSGRTITRHFFVKKDEFTKLIEDNRVYFPNEGDGIPSLKIFENEEKEFWFETILEGLGSLNAAKKELAEIFQTEEDSIPFDTAKPLKLIKEIIRSSTESDSIVLDFFAGSATTGHAVFDVNISTEGKRRFILIQLPEPLALDVPYQKVAIAFCDKLNKQRNIAEITKERLRRAGKLVQKDDQIITTDVGFRVFKLDTSNIKAWDSTSRDIEGSIDEFIDHIKEERTEQDILYELLLMLGLDLSARIESKEISGKIVHSIGAGVLIACLTNQISNDEIEVLAIEIVKWYKELNPATEPMLVFRDSAFEDDIAKTNITAIFNQNGITNIRSL
jgi:adenine-specific DNA-methyltransferase